MVARWAQDSKRLEQLGTAFVTIGTSPFEAIVSSRSFKRSPERLV
jgi:hypothetical protein